MHETTRQPVTAQVPAWGVVVFESHHARNFRMGVSPHAWLELFYVLDGAGLFRLDGHDVACIAGDVLVVPVGTDHHIDDDPKRPLAMYGLRVRPDVWANTPRVEELLPVGRVKRNKLLSRQVRAEFRQLLLEQATARPGFEAIMVGASLRLLGLIARSHTSHRAAEPADYHPGAGLRHAVEAYVADLGHRFLEPVKMDHVVQELHMSRRRFTELFRAVTGTTWSNHLRALRIHHAKELLRGTSKSVLSVAFESGFEDLSSFYRAFQREERTSPQRWRERKSKA